MQVFQLGAAITLSFLVLLLVAELRGSALLRWIAKPLASVGFIVAALSTGWPADGFGAALFIALALCLVGDVLLIPGSRAIFTAGLGAFLAGHLVFGVAFLIRGVDLRWVVAALLPLVLTAWLVHRWLRDHLPDRMRIPVRAYIAVITLMVALAAGTLGLRPALEGILLLVAATCFFVSDLAVARNRFVEPAWTNRFWGLPLYYGAQLVFAWVAAGLA